MGLKDLFKKNYWSGQGKTISSSVTLFLTPKNDLKNLKQSANGIIDSIILHTKIKQENYSFKGKLSLKTNSETITEDNFDFTIINDKEESIDKSLIQKQSIDFLQKIIESKDVPRSDLKNPVNPNQIRYEIMNRDTKDWEEKTKKELTEKINDIKNYEFIKVYTKVVMFDKPPHFALQIFYKDKWDITTDYIVINLEKILKKIMDNTAKREHYIGIREAELRLK